MNHLSISPMSNMQLFVQKIYKHFFFTYNQTCTFMAEGMDRKTFKLNEHFNTQNQHFLGVSNLSTFLFPFPPPLPLPFRFHSASTVNFSGFFPHFRNFPVQKLGLCWITFYTLPSQAISIGLNKEINHLTQECELPITYLIFNGKNAEKMQKWKRKWNWKSRQNGHSRIF